MIIGRYTLSHRLPNGELVQHVTKDNTLMVSYGQAACQLFGWGNRNYRISAIYLEYENTVSAVTPPSYAATDSILYYANLAPPKDYLRVPITGSPVVGIASGYEAYFTPGVSGNMLSIGADSVGSTGVNGLAFSNAENSRVYGVALVATPVGGDPSQDILITRGYFDAADQMVKPPTGQVHAGWRVEFTLPGG